eukprot:TRINITY_DN693_c0_g1_i2.p1 TRINITY_DN693_c0_g1~~TRINITY_DN693_c0_g1_i2.p1  ORF type:complete len:264 (+),score=62.16 TRINITY_DN693_c0_g1_i2:189-980(+)
MSRQNHWTPSEDKKLTTLVKTNGAQNWPSIAAKMVNREAKQCRERWLYHLNPNVIKGKLTSQEWNKVLVLQRQLGNRWADIARQIPGRSPNQIKNHWHSFNRRMNGSADADSSSAFRKGKKKVHSRQNSTSSTSESSSPKSLKRSRPTPLILSNSNYDGGAYSLRSSKRARTSAPVSPLAATPFTPFLYPVNAPSSSHIISQPEDGSIFVVFETPTSSSVHLSPFVQPSSGLDALVSAMYAIEEPSLITELENTRQQQRVSSY